MEAAGGMSGGKRNHEDLSDMMALVDQANEATRPETRPLPFLTAHLSRQATDE